MVKTYTESITKSVLDKSTGEVKDEIYEKKTEYKRTIKQGWRMYYIDYDEMLEKVVKSNRDITTINHLKKMISKDFELHINITKEAKRIGIGRDKLSKVLSRLVEANFLRRTEVGFISNPFMHIPYHARDILERQDQWKELEHVYEGTTK